MSTKLPFNSAQADLEFCLTFIYLLCKTPALSF